MRKCLSDATETNCGAYGGSVAFGSVEEETRHHEAELKKARNAIFAKYPELEIQMLVAKIFADGQVTI